MPSDADPRISDPFHQHIAPFRLALHDLIIQARAMRAAAGHMPTADSPAMAEKSIDDNFSGTWGRWPLTAVHDLGGLFMAAAEDHLSAIVTLVEQERVTALAHIALARVAIEACGRAYSLLKPGLPPEQRVTRLMTERVYSLAESSKLTGDNRNYEKRKKEILEEAARRKIKTLTDKGKPPAVGERRLSATDAAAELYGDPAGGQLGRFAYKYYCSITHSTIYGLINSLEPANRKASVKGAQIGYLKVTSQSVNQVLRTVTIGYILATEADRHLMGWQAEGWDSASATALRLRVR
jgi:hypothetical protein